MHTSLVRTYRNHMDLCFHFFFQDWCPCFPFAVCLWIHTQYYFGYLKVTSAIFCCHIVYAVIFLCLVSLWLSLSCIFGALRGNLAYKICPASLELWGKLSIQDLCERMLSFAHACVYMCVRVSDMVYYGSTYGYQILNPLLGTLAPRSVIILFRSFPKERHGRAFFVTV